MVFAKRAFLFLVTNILVIATITIFLEITGLNRYIAESGYSYQGLLTMCVVWGMGGAFISLWMSKWMAKTMYGVQIIDPKSASGEARELVETVHRMAKSAGLPKMPDVGFYESPEVNAFATGPSKSNSLVAVSSGLLQRLGKSEVEGVLGHEVAHIANGDMVTMTLIQGIVNAFVMFLARIVAQFLVRGDDEEGGMGYFGYFMTVIVLQIVFGILGSLVVNAFSRHREFRADRGGSRLAGKDKMIAALSALQGTTELVDNQEKSMASLKISGKGGSSLMALFSTHPPLEERIRRLQRGVA